MRSNGIFIALLLTVLAVPYGAAADASIDMDDPRRVVGRENDVRVDAQLLRETVSPGTPVGVRYQVQNFTSAPIALATKVANATYDKDSATITLSLGAEIPPDGRMPHMDIIAPGGKMLLTIGAVPTLTVEATNPRLGAAPRYVQVKVSFLRDVAPFANVIARQTTRGGAEFPDALFDRWFESQDTIFLNAVPVRFSPSAGGPDASVRARMDASRRF